MHLPAHDRGLPRSLARGACKPCLTRSPAASHRVPRVPQARPHAQEARTADILAFFGCSRTSNGPAEAINGGPEHFRGNALVFLDLTNYIVWALLEAGGFRSLPTPLERQSGHRHEVSVTGFYAGETDLG